MFCVYDRNIAENSGKDYIREVGENHALMLLNFFNRLRFSHGAEMAVMMPISTEKAVAASATLDNLAALDGNTAILWISVWRERGVL